MFLHLYYSHILSVYIPLVGINNTIIVMSYEIETRKHSEFIIFNCFWIYGTKNTSDASVVEYTEISSFLLNYNNSLVLSKWILVQLNIQATWRILGCALVIFTTVGTYVEWHYIKHFSANKCHKFEGTGNNLWSFLVPSNALKGFPSVPCEWGYFFSEKNIGFSVNGGH